MPTPPIKVAIIAIDKFAAPLRLLSVKITALRKPLDELRQHADRVRRGFLAVAKSIGMTDLASRLGKVRNALGDLGSRMGRLLSVAGMMGGALVGAFGALIYSATKAGGELYNTARLLGLSVEALQELQYAAKQSDVPVETFNTAIKKLGKNAVDAGRGVKNMKGAFDALGVRVKDTNGDMRGTEAIFIDVMSAMQKIRDPLLRNRVAFELFGRGAVEMVQMLDGGPEALAKLREEARRLGIMSEADAKAADDFGDSLDTLKQAVQGLINVVGGALFPALAPLVKQLTDLAVSKREDVVKFARAFAEDLPRKIENVTKALRDVVAAFQPLVSILLGIVRFLGPTGTAIAVFAGILLVTLGPAIAALISSIVMLNGVLIGTPIGWILLGIAGAIGAVTLVVLKWKSIMAAIRGPIGGFLAAINPLVGIPLMIAANWQKVVDTIKGAVGLAVSAGKFVAGIIPGWVKDTFNNMPAVPPATVMGTAGAINSTRTIRNEARLHIDVAAQGGASASAQQFGGLGQGLSMGPAMILP